MKVKLTFVLLASLPIIMIQGFTTPSQLRRPVTVVVPTLPPHSSSKVVVSGSAALAPILFSGGATFGGGSNNTSSKSTQVGLSTIDASASNSNDNNDSSSSSTSNNKRKKILTSSISAIVIIMIGTLIYSNPTIRNFDFKTFLITQLDKVQSWGIPGLILYAFCFALWEILVGVTTPVEMSAGMAFGLQKGIIGNAVGKIGGAISAFLIGRYILRDFVSRKLNGNEMMELVQESIIQNPIRVALIWRFSFLPEFVKNFGLAILPLKTIHFIIAVTLHGLPFTCLWTTLGNEADLLVRGIVTEPSKTLKLLVSGVYIFGGIISPSMVGLWVKGLKDQQQQKKKKKKKNKQDSEQS